MSYFELTFRINLESKFIMTVTFYVFRLGHNARSIIPSIFLILLFVTLSVSPLLKCNPVLVLSELRGGSNCASCVQSFSDINTVSSQVPSSSITT